MEMNEFLLAIGAELRASRKAMGLTQEKLAELAELHPTYVSEIERGRVNASIYTFYTLSRALHLNITALLNLPADNVDRSLEFELAEIGGRIRRLDETRRKLCLSAVKGLLDGTEE